MTAYSPHHGNTYRRVLILILEMRTLKARENLFLTNNLTLIEKKVVLPHRICLWSTSFFHHTFTLHLFQKAWGPNLTMGGLSKAIRPSTWLWVWLTLPQNDIMFPCITAELSNSRRSDRSQRALLWRPVLLTLLSKGHLFRTQGSWWLPSADGISNVPATWPPDQLSG